MFFCLSKKSLSNFPVNLKIHDFWINLDQGWQVVDSTDCVAVFKGYADDFDLRTNLNLVLDQSVPQYTGNFCVLKIQSNCVEIKTDLWRSFPIYVDRYEKINNLVPSGRTCWTSNAIAIDREFDVKDIIFDPVGSIDSSMATVDQIDQLLSRKINKFCQQLTDPVRVFLSGGVDTLLLYSYIKRFDIPHQIVWSNHCDHDWFWLSNHADITQHWGYRQIHHWQENCVLVSGAPGDEFTLRNPSIANLYLLHHGSNILEQLAQFPNCLHANFFNKYRDHLTKQIQSHSADQTGKDIFWRLCNTVINDWQHWHIGNTLTWTPLRDLNLFKLFLSLPKDLCVAQILDSSVSVSLIEKNVPGLGAVIGDQKNSGNYMKNVRQLLAVNN